MSEQTWTSIHNAFDPFASVPPDKLDEWFVERLDSPIKSPVHYLASDAPRRCILVGQPHTGKSSEPTKLAAEPHGRNLEDLDCRLVRAAPIWVAYHTTRCPKIAQVKTGTVEFAAGTPSGA